MQSKIQDETQISILSIPKVSSKLSFERVGPYLPLSRLYREISMDVSIKESAIHRTKTHPMALRRLKCRDSESTPRSTITELT